jgi:uncharacterized coiled-coil DUF342 family protein
MKTDPKDPYERIKLLQKKIHDQKWEIGRQSGLVKELKEQRDAANKAKDDAESNLASICDVVNSWAREENFHENHDYLGFMAIRDHINDLWGHVNNEWFERLDAANKRAEEVRTSADVVCAELRQRAEAAEKEHDELRELSRHDAADIATLGKTCDTLRGELKEVAEIVRPGSVSSPILAKILHKIEGIPGMEVK